MKIVLLLVSHLGVATLAAWLFDWWRSQQARELVARIEKARVIQAEIDDQERLKNAQAATDRAATEVLDDSRAIPLDQYLRNRARN